MDFLEKVSDNPYSDLYWNIPEGRKQGSIAVIGGNEQNFRVPVQVSEGLISSFPLERVVTALPDTLKSKLPPLENLVFLKSTESGSFADSEGLASVIDSMDFSLITGDLSKNSITRQAAISACQSSAKPLLTTRDAVDLIAEAGVERTLMREGLIIMGSVVQWQKIFRAVYYPKTLMVSQSLMQVTEAFHKFTLSYPVRAVSLHEGQIIVAADGKVVAVPLEKSGYTPLTIWSGELAGKIAALNLYNPGDFVKASVAGIFENKK